MEALAVTGWFVPGVKGSLSLEAERIERSKRDPEAMAELFREHYSPIARYIQRRVGHGATADDLTSEVFLTMVRYLPRYRVTSTPFRSWLYRLATNQVNRWARRQKRWVWKELQDHAAPAIDSPDQEAAVRLRTALLTLPLAFQSTLALHYLEEMSVETVAQVLGCAAGTVKSRLSRGREMLRTLLTEQDGEA